MARTRREPRRTREQAQAWRAEAEAMRAELEAEKARGADDTQTAARRLSGLTWRAVLDDSRVVASVQTLREARERNHFTETMKHLLSAGRI